jgi:hypothetical protein
MGLSDEHAIERILQRAGQKSGPNPMVACDGEQLKALTFHMAGEIGGQFRGGFQFSEANLGRNFPRGGSTNY